MSRPLQILVIDDDLNVLNTVTAILTGRGYKVATASNGKRGLAMFRATPPSVVLVDLLMPEMDGIETIREIRASEGATRIIAMSGGGSALGDKDLLYMMLPLGADLTLAKPFDADTLVTTLEHALSLPDWRLRR
jgi:DNA-binding response OmpR family regulator